jgi:glycosyltransferase involved in cell wall biosynthesis
VTGPVIVNQFHSGTGEGDAVTHHMFEIRQHLRSLGYSSDIYAQHIAPSLRREIRSIDNYWGEPDGVLIVHHSMGHGAFERVIALPDRIVTLYHNITPERFLADEITRRYARIGREQLRVLAARSEAGIADSNFNRQDMLDAGFRRVRVMPPRSDYSAFKKQPGEPSWWRTPDWVFVGRLVENKCQHELVRAFAAFARAYHPTARLLLVGDQSNRPYVERVRQAAADAGVEDRVIFKGKLSPSDLRTCYREAGLFVCLSEHEGFGVPLLEAMAAGLPVLALDRGAVAETLAGAGILLRDNDPWEVAALAKIVLEDDEMRARLVARQDERVATVEAFDVNGTLTGVIEEVRAGVRPLEVQIQGPFETSYSLAVLNRNVALELDRCDGVAVSIYATEGPGDYVPAAADVARFPRAGRLYERAPAVPYPDVVVRQMYPPRVHDSPGGITCQYFGWEESRLPRKYVDDFNRHLDGIGTMSSYVAEMLRDSGVTVPIEVMGVGVDPHDFARRPRHPELVDMKRFRFLHVSSAFPRKGVDVLLRAYFDRFSGADEVSLILKTFPNPHNTVGSLLEALERDHPDPPDVRWIDRDLEMDEIRALYNVASCYVHPARGEGFGLPVAEAMLAEVPVITVAYSGLADFCSEDTALTVPYRLEPARTHVSVPGSMWAEPDMVALGHRMRTIYDDPSEPAIAERVARARDLVAERFSWRAVGERWHGFIQRLERRRRVPRVATVTTWNSRCGIAEYSRYIVAHLGRHAAAEIYADLGAEVLSTDDDVGVVRTWRNRWEPDLTALQDALSRSAADLVHIQFNLGFYELQRLASLIEHEMEQRPVVITLHKTRDTLVEGEVVSLAEIATTLEKVDRVIVHQPGDRAVLEDMGIHANVVVIPHGGASDVDLPDRAELRSRLGLDGRRVLSTFGFLLPHKGTVELIRAVGLMRRTMPDIHLLVISAIHPDASSSAYRRECESEMARLGLQDAVSLVTDFLPDAEAHALLSASDLVVMPYRFTEESASGALRFVLGAGRPVAAPDIPIFGDARDALARLDDLSPDGLARELGLLVNDADRLETMAERVRTFARSVSWQRVAAAHREIYDAVLDEHLYGPAPSSPSEAQTPSVGPGLQIVREHEEDRLEG